MSFDNCTFYFKITVKISIIERNVEICSTPHGNDMKKSV